MTDTIALGQVSRPAALEPASDSDLAEVASARKELFASLDKIVDAIKANQLTQGDAQRLANRSTWENVRGALSGANDKDLAGMVKTLGGSLETTQSIVHVMLRLQTRKDLLLREFHSVLVDKIAKIQSDTQTLDSNQRTAALEIVSALQDQVEDQLLQYETIDRHEQRLNAVEATEPMRIAELGLIRMSQEALQIALERAQQQQDASTESLFGKLEQLAAQQSSFENRLIRIEAHLAASSSWKSRFQQHSVGIAGLLLALVAVVHLTA